MNKQPWPVRLLFAMGLLMATMPLLFKDYLTLPDFARGAVEGIGIGMEISAFVLMRRYRRGCKILFQRDETGDF